MNTALQLLLGLGIFQSLMLGIVLFTFGREKKVEARHISLLLFLLTILIFSEILELYHLEKYFSFLTGTSILLDLLIAPLIWNLAIFITDKTGRTNPWKWKMFFPFMIGLLWYITGFKWLTTGYIFSGGISDAIGIMVLYKGIIITIFLLLTIKEILPYINQQKSNTQLQVVHLVLWPFALIAALSYSTFWLQFLGVDMVIDSDYLGCVMGTTFVYYLTFTILRKPHLLGLSQSSFKGKKYNHAQIPENTLSQHLNDLLEHLKHEKPFINEKLSLQELADQLSLSTNTLSRVINEGAGKSFNDLINEFRMEEIKQKLLDPGEENKTILSLAFDSGFQSKATFNRIFKSHEGMTPSQFRKKYMSHPTH